ncbi:conserved hypothetical protein [Candidatus Roizmanbacteria bacterium]|nr:conserved hypothetical protein [Candidatus Roizmanbacteria bacterium]
MKKIILLLVIGGVFFFTGDVEAKLLPRFTNINKSVRQRVVSSGLVVSPKLRSDRRAIVLTLSNLQKVKNVTYTLMYQTDGVDQGVGGTLDSSSGSSVTRELLFGTCSDVCRYHSDITNMKLEIISELPNGRQTLKRYRIKV